MLIIIMMKIKCKEIVLEMDQKLVNKNKFLSVFLSYHAEWVTNKSAIQLQFGGQLQVSSYRELSSHHLWLEQDSLFVSGSMQLLDSSLGRTYPQAPLACCRSITPCCQLSLTPIFILL